MQIFERPSPVRPIIEASTRPEPVPRVPDIILIGAMKCATSTVSAWLEAHRDVFMVRGQDPNYFSRDEIWARGADWYASLFADARPGQLLAEGSNNYTSDALYPQAAARLAAACPGARLVYLVRDPVARILSHWTQVRADQGDAVPADPNRAVAEQPERFVTPSLYWRQIQAYRRYFPDDRIWIGFMEDLKTDPHGFFAALSGFLGIRPAPPPAERVRNPSQSKKLPGPLYSRLRALPGAGYMAGLLPDGLKRGLRTRLSQNVGRFPALSAETQARLVDILAADQAAFLAHCKRPADFWQTHHAPA